MSNAIHFLICIVLFFFVVSCDELSINNDGKLDNAESKIMTECLENALSSKTDIENNLLGKWTLVGYSQTVFQDRPHPEINLEFNDSTVVLKNITNNILDTLDWEVEEIIHGGEPSLRFKTDGNYTELGIQVFCDNHMYLELLAINRTIGYVFIYEKIE